MHSTILPPTPHHSPHPSQPTHASDSGSGYFGLAVAPSCDPTTSSGARLLNRNNLGPSSNFSIRSAAASPPQNLPININPDFEAFRRSSESRASFTLSQGGLSQYGLTPRSVEHKKRHANGADSLMDEDSTLSPASRSKFSTLQLAGSESPVSGEAAAQLRSPKRCLSHDSPTWDRQAHCESPVSFHGSDCSRLPASPPASREEKHPRLSPPRRRGADKLPPPGLGHSRGETLPENLDAGALDMVTPERVVNIIDSHPEETLILDLRVSTQYTRSHIRGALNLCIPSTLLKRPAYDVSKLVETVKDDSQRRRFERWKHCRSIVVYDASSTKCKEAMACQNILKKFLNKGWGGDTYIIQGGFAEFSTRFPHHVEIGDDSNQLSSNSERNSDSEDSSIAPVIGGCPMPATTAPANPFFGNIRQNMDLIGGVGQMSVQYPPNIQTLDHYDLPGWLSMAIDKEDKGKAISERFEQIEKREQKRMQEALSGRVVYGTPGAETPEGTVQLAGLEKGSKNRYNNIWPYEHSRVKLQGVPEQGCDYVNANFIGSSLSNKKYIATQGPIPATFNDFWQMVWQRDVRVIVMLTAEMEGSQVKAHNYWKERRYGPIRLSFLSESRASLEPTRIRQHRDRPTLIDKRAFTAPERPHQHHQPHRSKGSQQQSGKYTATATKDPISINKDANEEEKQKAPSEQQPPYVTVRKFTISHDEHPFDRMREVTHLQYASWPDFGAPTKPAHLLGLVEQCEMVVGANSQGHSILPAEQPSPPSHRPVLVHCSAGCGRTGTFCTVDSVIDMLKRQHQGSNARSARYTNPTPSNSTAQSARYTNPTPPDSTAMEVDDSNGSQLNGFNWGSDWLKGDDVDLIGKTVEEFRRQRLSMVQSLRQFVLCYETVLEWIVAQQGPVNPVSTLSRKKDG